jgi:sec-independent protein translocase protein TatA
MRPSFVQIAIVILIIVIIFGAPKLPQLARSLGQSMKIFKSEVKDLRGEEEDEDDAKTTEPGALNRNSSTESASSQTGSSAEGGTGTDEAKREKQDPQSHEK